MKSVRWFALLAAAPAPASTVFSPVTEDSGPDHVHVGPNLGPGPLVLWVDYIQPAGPPLPVDVPIPGCG